MNTNQIYKMKDLVNYQEGVVASRTIINKEVGTVTIFAFDKDQGLSEHVAPFDALTYILDGTGEVIISGQKHKLEKGEMIIMPANAPHSVKATQRLKMLLIMIRKNH